MATVFIPPLLQPLTDGIKVLNIDGQNVLQIINQLDQIYPGIKQRLVEGHRIKPSISVAVDSEVAQLGLLEKVGENSEIHFVPAIAGGA